MSGSECFEFSKCLLLILNYVFTAPHLVLRARQRGGVLPQELRTPFGVQALKCIY